MRLHELEVLGALHADGWPTVLTQALTVGAQMRLEFEREKSCPTRCESEGDGEIPARGGPGRRLRGRWPGGGLSAAVSIIEPRVIEMNEARVRTLEQVRHVVAGTQALEFRGAYCVRSTIFPANDRDSSLR